MRAIILVGLVLLTITCTPSETGLIAGTYDLYSLNGEVWEWWGSEAEEFSFEFRADSTLLNTGIAPARGIISARRTGGYSVIGIEEGCLEAILWLDHDPPDSLRARICGDTMTARYQGATAEWESIRPGTVPEDVYIRRR